MELQAIIKDAYATGRSLHIQGGNSKPFLGSLICADNTLYTHAYQGIVDYHPEELYIKVRGGTALSQVVKTLDEQGQMLPFEPPGFGPEATIGGTLACGLSGASAPWRGTARDFLLGCTIIDGRGEQLRFGGEVIKNVAGYDVSRLQCGALGTLGVLCELSIKTLPRPQISRTLLRSLDADAALSWFQRLNQTPWPLSGAAWHDGRAWIRLSGAEPAVKAAIKRIGGDQLPDNAIWPALQEHKLPFFVQPGHLWRVSLPRDCPWLELPGAVLLDWGGAQRWLISDAPGEQIQTLARTAGGHARSYANGPFQPLPLPLRQLQQRIKQLFDPKGILNPGKIQH